MMLKNNIKNNIKLFIPKKRVGKVSLFIVGAQKAGTSAFYNYLNKHKRVQGGVKKELNFFNHKEKYNQGSKWYYLQFKKPLFYKPSTIFLDGTPQYLNELDVAAKIYKYNPDAKIIILLRNPVSRAYSAWNMYRQFSELSNERKGKLIRSHIAKENVETFKSLINRKPFYEFNEYVEKELVNGELVDFPPYILKSGLYVDQVQTYLNLFENKNIRIIESNRLNKNKLKETNETLSWIGLDKLELDESDFEKKHSRSYGKPMDQQTKKILSDFYRPYNEKLYELIGEDYRW